MLSKQHNGVFEEETVTFLPMTPSEEGLARYLALFPKVNDPVAGTLHTMREQQGRRMPPIRLLDAEVPLYLGLARATLPESEALFLGSLRRDKDEWRTILESLGELYVRGALPLAGRALRRGWREVGDFLGGSIRSFWEEHPLERQLE